MAKVITRGQLWLLDLPKPDHRRPVLVLSRPALIDLLHTVTVAAVTTSTRGALTEVLLGADEGLKTTSCVNLVNIFTIPKSHLQTFIGTVSPQKMEAVCQALAIALDCGD